MELNQEVAGELLAYVPEPVKHGKAIVVADRGHVWIGDVTTGGDFADIAGARCIRRWGTTDGLNQLAKDGPQDGTRLDAAADLKVRQGAIIAIIPVATDKWPA